MNLWDKLSCRFDTHVHEDKIHAASADNILIAWPALVRGIEMIQPSGQGLFALDYGCGAGKFVGELQRRGYAAIGCDTSSNMIDLARKNNTTTKFYCAGIEQVGQFEEKPFSLLTSIMVFQFIDDFDAALCQFDKVLVPGGVISFASFNLPFIEANLGEGKRFSREGGQTKMCFPGVAIPVFLRDESVYAAAFKKFGYTQHHVENPPFTKEFVEKYPSSHDTTHSEYLVMTFQKPKVKAASP